MGNCRFNAVLPWRTAHSRSSSHVLDPEVGTARRTYYPNVEAYSVEQLTVLLACFILATWLFL